ncbi:MAG TPA: MlaD family protein [Verrucomicrobiae bacterium]|nr:MlaD family protein [Verrucomicrobiae bacterium]
MPVQDLTPQLRTRLSKVERAVGIFVIVATLLLLTGLGFYIYKTAQRKGWLRTKFPFHIYLQSGEGIRAGDEVTLLGFSAGRVTKVEPMPPFYWEGNVYVEFEILEPNHGYIWDDSKVKIVPKGFLGQRGLEVLQGGLSGRTNLHAIYKVEPPKGKVERIVGVWDDQAGDWLPPAKKSKGYGLKVDEGASVTERAEKLVAQIEAALPNILNLTNQLGAILTNMTSVTARADTLLADARPIVTNAAAITENLKDPNGSLGKWILSPELNAQLGTTLTNANQLIVQAKSTIANTDSNVTKLAVGLDDTIINLANITSNLNSQVQANSNLVSNVNSTIVTADTMMQGLKKHWLLRSAFKEKKPKEPKQVTPIRRKK